MKAEALLPTPEFWNGFLCASEPCPSGTHRHSGINGCHPISNEHKEGSGARLAHDKWMQAHGGKNEEEKGGKTEEKKDDGKNTDRKGRELKPCPKGQHRHSGIKGCHPIASKHKEGSGAQLAHEKWMSRHGDKKKEDDEKEEEKNEEPKSESGSDTESDSSEITPYTDGIAKPPSIQYSKGATIKELKKNNAELYKSYTGDVKSLRSNYDKIDWESDKYKNSKVFEQIFKDYNNKYGKELKLPKGMAKMPKEMFKNQMDTVIRTLEEYPILITRFNGFSTASGSFLMYCEFNNKISYNMSYYQYDWQDRGNPGLKENVTDPITREKTDWFFHFKGSTYGSSVCHELGHAMDNTLFALSMYLQGDYQDDLFGGFDKDAFTTELDQIFQQSNDRNKEVPIYYKRPKDLVVASEIEDRGEFLALKYKGDMKSSTYRELKTLAESMGYKLHDLPYRTDKRGTYEIHIHNPNASTDNANDKKKKYSDLTQEDFAKIEKLTQSNSKMYRKCEQRSMDRIRECEEMYKDLYGVDKIVPTDVYSVYGYYGTKDSDTRANLSMTATVNSSSAPERIAEAFEDVMSRKDKANSMSQLIVCHTEYEMYQIATGKFDMSFKDYITNIVGKDKFKDRIVKMMHRYIPFAMISNGVY